jgi:hypothetical protein
MRTLRLARVAAEAEGLLLRRRLRGIAIRAALAAVALLFLLGAIAVLHVYLYLRIRPLIGPQMALLAIAGGDAALAILLGLLAMRTPSDRIASDAVMVRDRAMAEMRSAFTVTAMLRPLAGILLEQLLLRRRKKS